MTTPDLFTQVHKGIRNALFQVTIALGRAGEGEATARARDTLRDVLRFIAHHGDNEDLLLVPRLRERLPAVADRMQRAHEQIEQRIAALDGELETASAADLYRRVSELVPLYLEHMAEEERELEPEIRSVLTTEEIADFGRRSVARTAPSDQRMMLGWMLPAMLPRDVDAFLARLPPELADELRPLASGS